jgi:hypothetical protein
MYHHVGPVQRDCSALEATGKYQLHTAFYTAWISACDEKATRSFLWISACDEKVTRSFLWISACDEKATRSVLSDGAHFLRHLLYIVGTVSKWSLTKRSVHPEGTRRDRRWSLCYCYIHAVGRMQWTYQLLGLRHPFNRKGWH